MKTRAYIVNEATWKYICPNSNCKKECFIYPNETSVSCPYCKAKITILPPELHI